MIAEVIVVSEIGIILRQGGILFFRMVVVIGGLIFLLNISVPIAY